MGPIRAYTVLLWLVLLLAAVAANSNSIPLLLRDKPRSIRGFKNRELSTARGFGKRSDGEFAPLDASQFAERESFPAEWFANEMQNNVELARLIVNKFIDSNQDGELSADELLRPLFQKQQPMVYK